MSALSQTAANVLAADGTPRKTGTAGATMTAGMAVYKGANNAWQKSLANSVNTATCGGIVLNGASTGQPIDICSSGNVNLGATLVQGETYCVSDASAGAIIPIADLGTNDFPVILGIAANTTTLQLNIQVAGVAKA